MVQGASIVITAGNIIYVDIFAYADILICMKTTAQIFKALSDETRLRIITLLLGGEELCVCDIMAALDLPQSTVSRHLSYLRNTGLVDDRRQGIWMHYRINKEKIEHGAALFKLLADILFEQEQSARDQRLLKAHLAGKEHTKCS
jgi:ArsR family transcriptional regulator